MSTRRRHLVARHAVHAAAELPPRDRCRARPTSASSRGVSRRHQLHRALSRHDRCLHRLVAVRDRHRPGACFTNAGPPRFSGRCWVSISSSRSSSRGVTRGAVRRSVTRVSEEVGRLPSSSSSCSPRWAAHISTSKRKTATSVNVEAVKKRDLEAIVTASGKIQAKRFVNISAVQMGRVTRAGRRGRRPRQGGPVPARDRSATRCAARSSGARRRSPARAPALEQAHGQRRDRPREPALARDQAEAPARPLGAAADDAREARPGGIELKVRETELRGARVRRSGRANR